MIMTVKTMNSKDLKKRKELLRNAEQFADDPIDKLVFEVSADAMDREINRRLWIRDVTIVIVVGVIVLVAVALCGCQTVKGSLGDLSWGAKVLADNIKLQEK